VRTGTTKRNPSAEATSPPPQRWAAYCAKAGILCTLHQLRHTHATELVNDGVSLATLRKRLGHKNLQTTLRYAEQSDAAADAEIRIWRRRRHTRP
jgi:integrase